MRPPRPPRTPGPRRPRGCRQPEGVARRQQGRGPSRPRRQAQPGDRATGAQHEALRQQLPEEAPPIGTEGGAHGELTASAGAGGEQEVGEVGAGDEQHHADRGGKHQQAAAGRADHGVLERRHHHPLPLVAARKGRFEADGDGVELGAGLVEGGAWREAADGADEVPAAARGGRIERKGEEDVCGPVGVLFDVTVGRWQHADHGDGHGVHQHCVPTTSGSAAKRRRQKPSLSRATRGASGRSSSAVNSRPSAGTPRVGKNPCRDVHAIRRARRHRRRR